MADGGDEILLADGFEDALVGWVVGACRQPVACYDYDKCAEILVKRDGMDEDEAYEYIDFNVIGAYVGPGTPLFVVNVRDRYYSHAIDPDPGLPLHGEEEPVADDPGPLVAGI
jgi:hypothetical protein